VTPARCHKYQYNDDDDDDDDDDDAGRWVGRATSARLA
jgi:hypothetical protein